MASDFPAALPGAKTDYDSDDIIASADQNAQGEDINALGAKLGIGATTPTTTNKILYGSATGTSAWATPDTAGIVDKTTAQTLTNKTLTSPAVTGLTGSLSSPVITTPQINDTSSDHQYIFGVSELAADRTVTLPLLAGNDEFVFKNFTQTLTLKTLTTPIIASLYQDAGKTKLMTVPDTASDTLVTLAATQALTNKTITPVALINTVISYTPDAAGTSTLDLATGNIHKITMPAGNITIAISNEMVGQCFMIEITQDGTGSRTVTWFSTIKWAGGDAPTLTTTASKRDTFGFRVTGTDTYDGFIVGQNI